MGVSAGHGGIYLDSCIVIYAVENRESYGQRVQDRLVHTESHLVISPLVAMECLEGPLCTADLVLRNRYLAFFDQCVVIDGGMRAHVVAAEIRARQRLRTPDAVHLATAITGGCAELWTNDGRLSAASHGLAVDVFA